MTNTQLSQIEYDVCTSTDILLAKGKYATQGVPPE
jgi:hypothetical protein